MPEEWLSELAEVATASGRINEYWEAWRKVLHDSLPDMVRTTRFSSNGKQSRSRCGRYSLRSTRIFRRPAVSK